MSVPSLLPLVTSTPTRSLQARSFCVLWQGVLALALTGWPQPLATLKAQINEREQGWSLRAENSGSQWPKISLACLREGRQLTLEQLRDLYTLTRRFDEQIASSEWRLPVRQLSAVVYACRNLERLLIRQDMPLAKLSSLEPLASDAVTADSSARVSSVLGELSEESAPAYLAFVNRDGGRLSHYVTHPHKEATLVAFCADQPQGEESRADGASPASAAPPAFLTAFERAVEELLPGHFYFFPWSSLHCTVRAL